MPTESKFPRLNIPNVNLWEFLFSNLDRTYPNHQVVFSDSETSRAYTYTQLKNATIKFGCGLLEEYDWAKGDVLALFSPNDVDYPLVTWGTLWAGGVVSHVNSNYTQSELEFQLVDSAAKVIVTHVSLLPTVLAAAEKLGFPKNKILLLGDEMEASRSSGFRHLGSLRGPLRREMPYRIDPADDVCYLLYSSGTTGKPKGVMLTHRNIVSNVMMISQGEHENLSWREDRLIGFLPFYHSYGLTAVVHFGFYLGIEVVVMAKFGLEKFCSTIERKKVTYAMVVPPVVLLLAKSPVVDKYDLSSLRMVNSGAAPLTEELTMLVRKRLGVPLRQGYGLSETSPVTHQQTWSSDGFPIGSIGTLLANLTSKFVSSDDQEVSDGEVGELWVKGPNVFKGYLNNATKTREAFSADGFFKTGDIGYQDAQGNVFITDRSKELIKYNAFQVAPAELEGVLAAHPKIADAAVVGVQDETRATEVPRAYVVLTPGVQAGEDTTAEIHAWMRSKVAGHKQLRGGIRYIAAVPKSAAGKIIRVQLRELVKAEAAKAGLAKL